MGVKGKYNWGKSERQARKDQYLDNLESTLKLFTSECLEEVSITESFEGQVRTLKLLTETGQFMKDLSSQLDDIQLRLEMINRKLFEQNKKSLETKVQE